MIAGVAPAAPFARLSATNFWQSGPRGDESGGSTAMSGDATHWIERLRGGDPAAMDRLIPIVYSELRAIAAGRLRNERANHTLSATALVNEAYLRLQRQERLTAADRASFLAVASNTMRQILIDYARTRKRHKRGGGVPPVPLDDVEAFLSEEEADEILELDEALDRLEAMNPEGAAVVQLRFFAGLTLEEAAQLLGVSGKTVQRRWTAARAWLRKEIDLPGLDS